MAAIIIVDIDGCLTVPHSSFKSYHPDNDAENRKLILALEPVPAMLELVKILPQLGVVIYMTGRPRRFEPETRDWFERYRLPGSPHIILSRMDHDTRPDHLVKEEFLDFLTINNKHHIEFVIEDRVSVVAMWRRRGILCLQPAPGDY